MLKDWEDKQSVAMLVFLNTNAQPVDGSHSLSLYWLFTYSWLQNSAYNCHKSA